ncbi:MAG TPA: ABC transporter permease [Pyrinomonadaceae bacterium]
MTNMNASTAEIAAPELKTRSYVSIEASRGWRLFSIGELWAHRELLYFLTLRDLKVRYKQTAFGIAWVIVQPVLMTIIFTVFLGMLARVPSNGLPYAIFVYSGLLPWMFFSSAVLGCTVSLTGNANLITKVYFPRVLMPAANVAGRFFDFSIAFSILLALITYYRVVKDYPISMSWKLALLPLVVILLLLLTLGMGMLVSCVNVKYRDVGVAIPVLLQLWMFVSPIIYPLNLVPGNWRMLYSLNPIVGVIQGFRAALFNEPFPAFALAVTVVFTLALLLLAALIFRRTEKTFADNV